MWNDAVERADRNLREAEQKLHRAIAEDDITIVAIAEGYREALERYRTAVLISADIAVA